MQKLYWSQVTRSRYNNKPTTKMWRDKEIIIRKINYTGEKCYDAVDYAVEYDSDYVVEKLARDLSGLEDLDWFEFMDVMVQVYRKIQGINDDQY